MRDRRHFWIFELESDALDDDSVFDIRIDDDVCSLAKQLLLVPKHRNNLKRKIKFPKKSIKINLLLQAWIIFVRLQNLVQLLLCRRYKLKILIFIRCVLSVAGRGHCCGSKNRIVVQTNLKFPAASKRHVKAKR